MRSVHNCGYPEQGTANQILRHAVAHGIADDLPIPEILDGGQVGWGRFAAKPFRLVIILSIQNGYPIFFNLPSPARKPLKLQSSILARVVLH
jgi:hypothetical protein